MPEHRFLIDATHLEYDFSEGGLSNSIQQDELGVDQPSVSFLNLVYGNEVYIPASIFSSDLAPLQALVKYLKEEKQMSNKDISAVIKRDIRTVWLTYQAIKNKKITLDKSGSILLPLGKICSGNLSILEAVVYYLHESGLTFAQAARVLDRDQRTIWTVSSRAIKKIEMKNEKSR